MTERGVSGGCLCGAVRFLVRMPTLFCGHCHCSMCRRNHGAGYVTWFAVPNDQLELTAGQEVLVRRRSSEHGSRSFCSRCGTPLFCEIDEHPGTVDIPLASVEGAIDREPGFHGFFDDRASWSAIADGLPRFGGASGNEPLTAEPVQPRFPLGTAVYAERGDDILILRRNVGEMAGSWYLPGGAHDAGESIEVCAERELFEETGLRPQGPLELVGLFPLPIYGTEVFIASYRCACPEGEVKLSSEHSDFRWIPARRYRAEFFSEGNLRRIEAANARVGRVVRSIQRDLDVYLERRPRPPA